MNAPSPDRNPASPDGRPENQQPKWRRDFPIDWPQDEYVSRRDLTKFMVLTSLAFAVGQFWILVQNFLRKRRGVPPEQKIATLDQIPVGGSVLFHYPDKHTPCLLLRPDENTLLAYAQQCTHLTCPVIPRYESGDLFCPCHSGVFEMRTGRALAGPPSRPLPRIKLKTRNNTVYAAGLEERTA